MNNFGFAPRNGSGVIAPLTPVSSALQCLETLLKQSILEELRDNINDYAEMLCRKNNPPTKRSLFASWTPVTLCDMYRLVKVVFLSSALDFSSAHSN